MSWKPGEYAQVDPLLQMLSVSEALERLLAALPITNVETVRLTEAGGRVLAEDLAAPEDSPRFANSSMDGFAVRAEDVQGASETKPIQLAVVADIPAGVFVDARLQKGQAMRIMTGAPMPPGGDAIVPVEDTDANRETGAALPARVQIKRAVAAGEFVRPAGQDFKQGDVLLKKGTRLRAQEIGLLAQLGKANISMYRKPRVAIFSSGEELVPVEKALAAGKIHETNSYVLAELVRGCGAEAIVLGIARDELNDVKKHLDRAVSEKVDLILSSAGVSVGAYDYLREAVMSKGTLDFWKVNMRPGRPFTFGNYQNIPYIGLPGNPASAFVGFEVFVRSALQKIGGVANWKRNIQQATLTDDTESDGRESFLRVRIETNQEGLHIYLTGHQGSGNLYSLVQAQGLLHVPAGVKQLSKGSLQEVWLI